MSSGTAQTAAVEEREILGTTKYGWRVVLFVIAQVPAVRAWLRG
jgi:hypothetical protein